MVNNNCILIEIIELIDYRLSARLTLSLLSQPLTSNELNVERSTLNCYPIHA